MANDGRKNEIIMRLKKANCRNCYKCVRACPVKSISILGDQAKIEERRCMYCGKCYLVCPQDARDLIGDLDSVKQMVANGEKVYISLSSTFSMYFPDFNLRNMAYALKKLGANHVEETAIGAKRVLEEYMDIINSRQKRNLLSSHCPATNYMIQKYFPNLIKWMFPVVTPLEAHALMMKKAYGDDIRVIGIGPCIAYRKLVAQEQEGGLIDAYVNYEELENWMKDSGLTDVTDEDSDTYAVSTYKSRYIDEANGLFMSLNENVKKRYTLWSADGVTRAASVLKDFNDAISGHFVELLSCNDGCLGGPIVRLMHKDTFESKTHWMWSIREIPEYMTKVNPSEAAEVDVRKEYHRMDYRPEMPTEEQIADLLLLVGKRKKEDMLDCSGCGYPTCRAKAIAVFQGMADPYMCIPHARDSAELQSNLLFDNSPSGVLVMDDNMQIIQANFAAEKILGLSAEELSGHLVTDYISKSFIDKSKMMEIPNRSGELHCDAIGKIFSAIFFKVYRRNIYMFIFDDITEHYQMIENEKAVRRETIQIAKNVVEKQMTIAQEIASLLGNSTAETKLAFNKIRDSLEKSDEGWES